MTNYTSNELPPWHSASLQPRIKSIVVEDGVTTIGNYAFYRCGNATSVSIGQDVTAIRTMAFCECDGLTAVALPDGLMELEGGVFDRCVKLESVYIPDGVERLGSELFRNCTSLKWVALPADLTYIVADAFRDCTALADVFYPGPSMENVTVNNSGNLNAAFLEAYCHNGYTGTEVVALSAGSRVSLPCHYAYKGERIIPTAHADVPGYSFTAFTTDHGIADAAGVTVATDGDFQQVTVNAQYTPCSYTVTFDPAQGGIGDGARLQDGDLRCAVWRPADP